MKGRNAKRVEHDPVSILRSIQDEFRTAAGSGDGYFVRMELDRAAFIGDDGTVDQHLLSEIDRQVFGRRLIVFPADWVDDSELSECWKEVVMCRRGEEVDFQDRLEDLAASALCMRRNTRELRSLHEREYPGCSGVFRCT